MTARIRKTYVDGRWGQVHLRRMGSGAPLLLLHHSPLSGAMFEAALPLLGCRFDAVAVDTAGYGQSDPPPPATSIVDHGEALVPVLDALGWKTCHLLGHHTGAAIAAAFAARHPGRVARLVLNGIPLLTSEQQTFFRTFDFKPLPPREDGGHLLTAWNQRLTAATPGWTDLRAMHRYVVEMLAINETYHLGFEAALAHDPRPDLEAIRVPTMIPTNSGDDLYDCSLRAAEVRPDFSLSALDGGTHDIVDEHPEAWAEAVAAFLNAG